MNWNHCRSDSELYLCEGSLTDTAANDRQRKEQLNADAERLDQHERIQSSCQKQLLIRDTDRPPNPHPDSTNTYKSTVLQIFTKA